MSKKNKLTTVYTYYPLVQSSDIKKLNFYYIFLSYIFIVSLTFSVLPVFIGGVVLAIPFFIYLKWQEKLFRENLRKWQAPHGSPYVLNINTDNGDVMVGGYELNFKDVSNVKIIYNEPPEMKGFTKYIILMSFLNCTLEFELYGGRKVYMPIHSRDQIKSIVKLLAAGDFQTSFDQKIYRLCKL